MHLKDTEFESQPDCWLYLLNFSLSSSVLLS